MQREKRRGKERRKWGIHTQVSVMTFDPLRRKIQRNDLLKKIHAAYRIRSENSGLKTNNLSGTGLTTRGEGENQAGK